METRKESVVPLDGRKRQVASVPPAALIEFKGVRKLFATRAAEPVLALTDVDLTLAPGEFVTVVGPSGCGKTTLLRLLAGLEQQTSGEVLVGAQAIAGPHQDIAVVFQSATLLPWYTVMENVLVPVRLKRRIGPNDKLRAQALLEMAGLRDFARKYPSELSGGMQQRVAICRALIRDPRILLMDEPFGALDAMTRETMNIELMRIWAEHRKTVLFITHSIPEAVLLGDRVVVMTPRPGRIAEIVDIDLERPRNLHVMGSSRFGAICDHIRSLLGTDSLHGSGF